MALADKYPKLLHPHYLIGHGTGMSEREWENFAKNYPIGKFDNMKLENEETKNG